MLVIMSMVDICTGNSVCLVAAKAQSLFDLAAVCMAHGKLKDTEVQNTLHHATSHAVLSSAATCMTHAVVTQR